MIYIIAAAVNETTIVYRRHSNNDLGEIVYLSSPGDLTSLNSSNGSCCSLVSNKPVLVTQLGPGHTHIHTYICM